MKYAWFPGCVSRGACKELYQSMTKIAPRLGLELVELKEAACTGAGVLSERDSELADTLNARTFAMAEALGLPLLNNCSTCQGVMSQVRHRLLNDSAYLGRVNETLKGEGLTYQGKTEIKNLLWVLVEDIGLETLRSQVRRPLKDLRVGPFYGCYLVRPTEILGYQEHPGRGEYLEKVIETLGATPVDFVGKDKCCGFPILTMNRINSLRMAGDRVLEAKEKNADCLVTPCPLCHLNLDSQQPDAEKIKKTKMGLPILHLPQLVGLAMGIDPEELWLDRHIVSTRSVTLQVKA